MKKYTISTNKVKSGYIGRVKYFDSGIYLFSESTGIVRLNKEDAKEDAEKLAQSRI